MKWLTWGKSDKLYALIFILSALCFNAQAQSYQCTPTQVNLRQHSALMVAMCNDVSCVEGQSVIRVVGFPNNVLAQSLKFRTNTNVTVLNYWFEHDTLAINSDEQLLDINRALDDMTDTLSEATASVF